MYEVQIINFIRRFKGRRTFIKRIGWISTVKLNVFVFCFGLVINEMAMESIAYINNTLILSIAYNLQQMLLLSLRIPSIDSKNLKSSIFEWIFHVNITINDTEAVLYVDCVSKKSSKYC